MLDENVSLDPIESWRHHHLDFKKDFVSNTTSFIKQLLPELAVQLGVYEVLQLVQAKFGTDTLTRALNPNLDIESPVKQHKDATWLKKANMVGVNIRTLGNFFNLVKYTLTLSKTQNSIHILPIWEPGVVASLYGKTSWNINPEFFSKELAQAIPNLDTVEKQLKVVVNLIHLMGKTIGLDVIPHTDRFSEITFLYPDNFEWVLRKNAQIISIANHNSTHVEEVIWRFLKKNGTANGSLITYSKAFFFDAKNPILDDNQKLEVLFGKKEDYEKRLQRRLALMQALLDEGYETLPVTMAPPYRGLHLEPENFIYDEIGNKWYNYVFDKPQGMSRVFGPLTRYKFYPCVSDQSQELDFENPNTNAWDYIAHKYFECQQSYNFDFMRGDMAHVQPRPSGVPTEIDPYYDPLKAIKNYIIQKGVAHFGFFAETFLAPPNEMGYGNENDHLEAIEADSTLGDLQGSVVGSNDFMLKLSTYLHLLESKRFAPNFTMITADKDDPRFDLFYRKGNHLRFFVGLFLPSMPSYMSLGFECRNPHLDRGKNEEYSKLYVFQISDNNEPDKVTHGPFIWGTNYSLFNEIEKMKLLADKIIGEADSHDLVWIKKPSQTEFEMSWQVGKFVFVVQLHPENKVLPSLKTDQNARLVYSSYAFSEFHVCTIYEKF
jgi:hypothetical protein